MSEEREEQRMNDSEDIRGKKDKKEETEEKLRLSLQMHDVKKEELREKIEERITGGTVRKNEKRPRRLVPVLSACLALLLVIGTFTGLSVAAEAKEYRKAVDFFNEYALPTDGLSRKEIKEVYKDITMKTYCCETTIELLNQCSIQMVQNSLSSVDRDSLEALWNQRNTEMFSKHNTSVKGDYGKYRYEIHYPNENKVNIDSVSPDVTVIVKYEGEKELWSYTVPYEMYVFLEENLKIYEDGILVYGANRIGGSMSGYATAFFLDQNGKKLWEYQSSRVGTCFQTAIRKDGRYFCIGNCDELTRNSDNSILDWNRYSIFTWLDEKGVELQSYERQSKGYTRYETIVSLGDFFLTKRFVTNGASGEDYSGGFELASIDAEGKDLDIFTYTQDGKTYEIQDIFSYNGKAYLSAMLPKNDAKFEKKFVSYMEEYYKKWNEMAEEGKSSSEDGNGFKEPEMSEKYQEGLTALFSEAYTAALLMCDNTAAITKAYTVENTRAGKLSVSEDGKLQWQIMRIDDVKNAPPYLSSRRVDILATEFLFSFNEESLLVKKQEVGPYPMMY